MALLTVLLSYTHSTVHSSETLNQSVSYFAMRGEALAEHGTHDQDGDVLKNAETIPMRNA